MAQFETRNNQCIYCIDRFSSREEFKAHPCYAVKNEKEDTMWSTDMTKLLISLYKEHKRKFHLVNIYRRAFLYVIAEIMKLQGCQDVTGDMCYNKWMGLRRLFMDEKTEQINIKMRSRMVDKSGQASTSSEFKSTFQYFDAMDSVLGQEPDIVGIPGGIDSSDPDMLEKFNQYQMERNAAKRARKCALQQSVDLDDTENDELSTKLPYRYRALLRRIDKKEEKVQRHHEEQQALRRESLDILRNILNNKESASAALHQPNEELNNGEDMMMIDDEEIFDVFDNNAADIPNLNMVHDHDILQYVQAARLNQIPDNLMPDVPLDDVMQFENNAGDIRNEGMGADDLVGMPDEEMDIRTCFLNQFRLRKRERRINKQRRNEESQALIRECSELLQNIQRYK